MCNRATFNVHLQKREAENNNIFIIINIETLCHHYYLQSHQGCQRLYQDEKPTDE